jgi:formylglycine-generating enzyme required for sulfatase activity
VEHKAGEPPAPGRAPIRHGFAIASKEVTVEQFQRFLAENPRIVVENDPHYSPEPTCPINTLTWYVAAAYCNW